MHLRRVSNLALAIIFMVASGPARAEDWPSWGGPRGDFTVDAGRLAESWPDEGPPRLWERPLGRGYSAVIVQNGKLYTMYGDGNDDVLVALDVATGKTLWEDRDTPEMWPDLSRHFGLGPNEQIDSIEVRWPDGALQQLVNVAADQILSIEEPEA